MAQPLPEIFTGGASFFRVISYSGVRLLLLLLLWGGNGTWGWAQRSDATGGTKAAPHGDGATAATTTTVWTGSGGNTDWYNLANWNPCLPGSTVNVVIPTGAKVNIGEGVAAVQDLDIQGTATLSVSGTGNLEVHGAFTTAGSNSFQPAAGMTHFCGTGNQPIPAATYVNLTITGDQAKVLSGDVKVLADFNISAGLVRIGDHDLLLAKSGQSLIGYGPTHFVVTDGSGRLGFAQVGDIAGNTAVFPIGTSAEPTDYTPATLTNTGKEDTFWAAVTDTIPQIASGAHPGGPRVVHKTWNIVEGAPGGSNARLTLEWNQANEGVSFDRSLCAVSQFENGAWSPHQTDWGPATVLGAMRYSRTLNDLTSFSVFAVQDANLPLPVELTLFTADRQLNNDVQLTWETASEQNVKGFEVQVNTGQNRSAASWRALGFVNSEASSSKQPRRYRFADTEMNKTGVRYYRLRQVNLNGAEYFSQVRTVRFAGVSSPTVQVWPNPFVQDITVELATAGTGTAELNLFDTVGRQLLSQSVPVVAGSQNIRPMLPAGLAGGAYVLHLRVDGQTLRVPVIRQ